MRATVLVILALAGAAAAPPTGDEMPVLRAVLSARLKELRESHAADQRPVVCVGLAPGSGQEKDLLAGLADAALAPSTGCEMRRSAFVGRASGRPALQLKLGPIERRSPGEAWVTTVELARRGEPVTRTFRVVLEDKGWVSLGPVMTDAPIR